MGRSIGPGPTVLGEPKTFRYTKDSLTGVRCIEVYLRLECSRLEGRVHVDSTASAGTLTSRQVFNKI